MQLTQNRPDRGQKDQPAKSVSSYARATWSNLTDEEIGYLTKDRQRFCDTVSRKYGLSREQVEAQLHQWERELREAA